MAISNGPSIHIKSNVLLDLNKQHNQNGGNVMKKSVIVLLIVLVMALLFVMTASASQPTEISGHFYFVEPYGPNDYCVTTSENYVPDGFLDGCVEQLDTPGLGAHGTMYLTIDIDGGLSGACKYNLRTYDNDGIALFVANRCTGELAGFHMKAVGWATNGKWEGSYHFDP